MHSIAVAIVVASIPFHLMFLIAMCWVRRKYNGVEAALRAKEQSERSYTREEMIAEYNRAVSELARARGRPPILMTRRDTDVEERFKQLMTDMAAARRARILNAALLTASKLLGNTDMRRLCVSPLSQKIGVDDISQNPVIRGVFDLIAATLASYECVEPSLSEPGGPASQGE